VTIIAGAVARCWHPAASIALFERAKAKVKVFADIDLADHVEWPRFVAGYRIGVEFR
jgi:hypothetical protein